MREAHLLLAAAAVALLAPTAARPDDKSDTHRSPFIHVEVRESDGERGAVKVNLPLALVGPALAALQDDVDAHTRLRFDHSDLDVSDLRRMWKAMRDAGETEFVSVQDEGETVRIYRQGEKVCVKVDGRDSEETVRIQVPVAVLDALLSGEGETLDLQAAVDELSKIGKGEIVRIEDEGDFVRVWID